MTAPAEVNADSWAAKDAHDGHLPALGVPASAPAAPAAPHLADGGGAGWHLAPCTWPDSDPDAWFSRGGRPREAIDACGFCPMRERCLAAALAFESGRNGHDRFGIWGGLTPHERAALDPLRLERDDEPQPCPWPSTTRGLERHASRREEPCEPCFAHEMRETGRARRNERIRRMAAEGKSPWEIALSMGVDKSDIKRILARQGAFDAVPADLAL